MKFKNKTSPILKKIYFFITSEFEILDNTLDQIYEWLYLAILQKNKETIKNNIQNISNIKKQESEYKNNEFDEEYFNNLLSKI